MLCGRTKRDAGKQSLRQDQRHDEEAFAIRNADEGFTVEEKVEALRLSKEDVLDRMLYSLIGNRSRFVWQLPRNWAATNLVKPCMI